MQWSDSSTMTIWRRSKQLTGKSPPSTSSNLPPHPARPAPRPPTWERGFVQLIINRSIMTSFAAWLTTSHPSVDLGAVKEGGGEVLLLTLADSDGPDDAGDDDGGGNGGVHGQGMRWCTSISLCQPYIIKGTFGQSRCDNLSYSIEVRCYQPDER